MIIKDSIDFVIEYLMKELIISIHKHLLPLYALLCQNMRNRIYIFETAYSFFQDLMLSWIKTALPFVTRNDYENTILLSVSWHLKFNSITLSISE